MAGVNWNTFLSFNDKLYLKITLVSAYHVITESSQNYTTNETLNLHTQLPLTNAS